MTPNELLAWATRHPSFLFTILTALAGTGGAARHYRKHGTLPLSSLPWRAYRRLYYTLRRRFFTVPRPRKPTYTPQDVDVDTIRTRLGRESFESGWPLSYRYHGEDLNTRRYYLAPDADYPHRQIHIRGFQLESGDVELIAHDEPAPKHHPRAHLQESDMHDATEWLREAWESPALDPRTFDRAETDDS